MFFVIDLNDFLTLDTRAGVTLINLKATSTPRIPSWTHTFSLIVIISTRVESVTCSDAEIISQVHLTVLSSKTVLAVASVRIQTCN